MSNVSLVFNSNTFGEGGCSTFTFTPQHDLPAPSFDEVIALVKQAYDVAYQKWGSNPTIDDVTFEFNEAVALPQPGWMLDMSSVSPATLPNFGYRSDYPETGLLVWVFSFKDIRVWQSRAEWEANRPGQQISLFEVLRNVA